MFFSSRSIFLIGSIGRSVNVSNDGGVGGCGVAGNDDDDGDDEDGDDRIDDSFPLFESSEVVSFNR